LSRAHDPRLGALRRALVASSEWSPAREARLVARVLERTTRADPSPRGDLVLFLHYLRARLGESILLRVVAASLLLHLAALPVLAYLVLRAERPAGYRISVELPQESPFAPEPETPAPVLEPAGPLAGQEARLREQRENHLARARFLLETRGRRAPPPGQAAGEGAPLETRLLQARGALLCNGLVEAWPPEAELAGASDLALALWATLVLDRFVLAGELPPLGDLILARAQQRTASEGDEAGQRLLRAALARARRYGLAGGASPQGTEQGEELDDPLEDRWFTGLAAAAGELGLGQEPVVRAWIEWGGR
jgi:hypothetical protein